MNRSTLTVGLLAGVALLLAGCVRRELTIISDPPGALVFLNDQEVGRTPVTRQFVFYGTYDVVLRMEGYETLKTKKLVLAPWWQWVPIDLAAEALPLTDRQKMEFKMVESPAPQPTDPAEMLRRAEEMRLRLPEPRATTGPTTSPTTSPTTQP